MQAVGEYLGPLGVLALLIVWHGGKGLRSWTPTIRLVHVSESE